MWIYTLFPQILNMSLTASIVIIFVLLARLLLKKAPKIFPYALWAVVLFRLLCPLSISSEWSLLNVFDVPFGEAGIIEYIPTDIVYTENPQVNIPVPGISEAINDNLPQGEEQLVADPLEAPMAVATLVWFIGMLALLLHSIVSLIKLRRKLIGAVHLRDNVYLADYISSPFVMGLLWPKIYLPSTLTEQEQTYIIQHEQHHIRRFDPIIKILAFTALCVHWFNPLVWLAFVLSGKDMEMSCDEAVMKSMDSDIRAEYSTSLLSLATGRKIFAGTPLAFGEGDTKSRIKNVMRYKKPALWSALAALIVVVILYIAFASNPQRTSMKWAKSLRVADVAKIELVLMSSKINEQYRLLDPSEFSEVVGLANQSRGRYIPDPEALAGSSIDYYITTTDGVRHTFINGGNTYLYIDGDNYDAGYNWLSSWGNETGNAPIPETFLFGDEKFLTMAELNTIAQKGENITWDDFAPYTGQEVGSGLYIMRYPMKQSFYVTVGGTPGEEPMYIRLCYTETEEYIDIRQESINSFIENMTVNNGDSSRLTGEITSIERLESDYVGQPSMYLITVLTDEIEMVWRTFVSTTASLPIDSLKPGDVVTAMCSPELITVSPQRWNVHHIQF